jgi:lysophospholipase L1-like esterase
MRWLNLLFLFSLLSPLPAGARTILAAKPPATTPIATTPIATTPIAATPIDRMDLPWWRARHEAKLRELAEAKPNLIWLGDSITQDWERSGPPEWRDFAPVWQRFYGGRHAVNLGFTGDTTASLIWRIRNGEVAGIAPKAAVVLIGANNLGRVHWSAEDTVAGIDTIIAELHRRLPETKILLLGILPSGRSAWVTQTATRINHMLADQMRTGRYKDDRLVAFQDLTALFLRDGAPDRDLFFDWRLTPPDPLLHPSAQGQAVMARAIEPTVAEMLGDQPR